MNTHAGSTLQNLVTLTFDPLPQGQWMLSDCQIVCVLCFVLIAQAAFLLDSGHTETNTHTKSQIPLITSDASAAAGLGKENTTSK